MLTVEGGSAPLSKGAPPPFGSPLDRLRRADDERAELRELDHGQRARRLARPPGVRVPLRVVGGLVAEREARGRERAREEQRRAPRGIGPRDEDRWAQAWRA